jgi:hypothetical protein
MKKLLKYMWRSIVLRCPVCGGETKDGYRECAFEGYEMILCCDPECSWDATDAIFRNLRRMK